MKKKTGIIVTSVMSIACCASLITGATFALFTSESKVNIAVTSGKVDVLAHAENITLTSGLTAGNLAQTSATITDNIVILDKIVPGDKVTFDIVVENKSDVAVQYQTVVSLAEGVELFSGLEITLDQKQYDGMTAYGAWTALTPAVTDVARIPVTIELPAEAGNEYQGLSCKVSFAVNAVQGNADVPEAPDPNMLYLYTANDMRLFAASVNKGNNFAGKTVKLMSDINLAGIEWTPIGSVETYPAVTFAGTFDGAKSETENYTISNMTATSNVYNYASAGFFGSITGTVKNINFDNASVESTHYAGVVVGFSSSNKAVVENCHVKNSVVTSVPELMQNGNWDNGDKAGGVIGYCVTEDSVANCSVSNSEIKAYRDVGGICGAAQTAAILTNNTVSNVKVIVDRSERDGGEAVNAGVILGRNVTTADALPESNTATGENSVTKLASPTTVQSVIEDAKTGDVIYLTAGNYRAFMLKNSDGTRKTGLKITGDAKAVVDAIKLNASEQIVIEGLTFDAAGATEVYSAGASNPSVVGFSNITSTEAYNAAIAGVNNGAHDITIRNCVFQGTPKHEISQGNRLEAYSPICFEEVGRAGYRSFNITVEGCDFNVNAFNYLRLNYIAAGETIIKNNVFGGGEFKSVHHNINMTSNSSDVALQGNSFNNWTIEEAAFGSSKAGDNPISITFDGNVFSNTFDPQGDDATGYVISLKNSYKKDVDSVVMTNNRYEGAITKTDENAVTWRE